MVIAASPSSEIPLHVYEFNPLPCPLMVKAPVGGGVGVILSGLSKPTRSIMELVRC